MSAELDNLWKQAATLEKEAAAVPDEVLAAAQADPAISGTVLRAGGAHRVPIYDGDVVAGFFTPRQEGDEWRLGPIFVMPAHRGRGLAQAAVREFMEGRPGWAEIDEDNEASQRLFESSGFSPAGDGRWVKEASRLSKKKRQNANFNPGPAAEIFHGSSSKIDKFKLTPHYLVDDKPVVFGTPERGMAISHLARWNDGDFDQSRVNAGPLTMTEKRPGAFEEIYGGKKGYLYKLKPDGFEYEPQLMRSERVSTSVPDILDMEEIPDALKALEASDVRLVRMGHEKEAGLGSLLARIFGRDKPGPWDDVPEDAELLTAIPAAALDSVRERGLLSSERMMEAPDLWDLARPDGLTDGEWRKEQLAGDEFDRNPLAGPSAFVKLSPTELPDNHPTKRFSTQLARIALGRLLRDHPDTKLWGMELAPGRQPDRSWDPETDIRAHYLKPDEVNELLARSPEDLWRHHESHGGKYYAANVPHISVMTPDGRIDPKYLEIEKEARATHAERRLVKAAFFDELEKLGGVSMNRLRAITKGKRPVFHMVSDGNVDNFLRGGGVVHSPSGAAARGSLREVEKHVDATNFDRLPTTGAPSYVNLDGHRTFIPGSEMVRRSKTTFNPFYERSVAEAADHARENLARLAPAPGKKLSKDWREQTSLGLAGTFSKTKHGGKNSSTVSLSRDPISGYGSVGVMAAPSDLTGTLMRGRNLKPFKTDQFFLMPNPSPTRKDLYRAELPNAQGTVVYDPQKVSRERARELKASGGVALNRALRAKLKRLDAAWLDDVSPGADGGHVGLRGVPRGEMKKLRARHSPEDMVNIDPEIIEEYERQAGVKKYSAALMPGFDDEFRKLAGHAERRLAERAPTVPSSKLDEIQAEIDASDLNPSTTYHVPLGDGSYAVIAPVGRWGRKKHVIKTVLGPGMLPPGSLMPKAASALWDGFADEIEKVGASLLTELLPQQQRVLEKLDSSGGVLVVHGLGSGKTLTSIAAGVEGDLPIEAVVPASLQANYEKEVGKHVDGELPRRVRSYEIATRDGIEPDTLVVIDEAHRLRNTGTKRYQALAGPIQDAPRRLLLTGTPIYNAPSDLAPLANLAAGDDVLPVTPEVFNRKFIKDVPVLPTLAQRLRGVQAGVRPQLKNRDELVRALAGHVDVHSGDQDGFPERQDDVVEVPMSSQQAAVYRFLLNQAPASLRAKIRSGLPANKQESRSLNSFLAGVRQASGSPRPYVDEMADEDEDRNTPKIQRAVEALLAAREGDPNFRGLVYSNYLDAGLKPYSRRLAAAGVPHSMFTGGVSKAERARMVEDYNAGETPVLLVSSSGGEGLDLKGTKLVQVLEPHFNNPKIEQVVGRGRRYGSHDHLPEEDRAVLVQRFLSVLPERRGLFGGRHKSKDLSTDQWLQRQAGLRDKLTAQFMEALQAASDIESLGALRSTQ